jgi:hypothetical protein
MKSTFVVPFVLASVLVLSTIGVTTMMSFPIQEANASALRWVSQFGTSNSDEVFSVVSDSSGNAYITGRINSACGDSVCNNVLDVGDGFVRKYSSGGTLLWTNDISSTNSLSQPTYDAAFGLSLSGSSLYVAGKTGGLLQSSPGPFDGFVRKINTADGTSTWTTQFGSSAFDSANDVVANSVSVFAVGYTDSTFGFGQGNVGGSDAFIRRLDTNGLYAGCTPATTGSGCWTDVFGTSANDFANGVTADSSAVYVVGQTGGTLTGTGQTQTNAGGNDIFVRKYSATPPTTPFDQGGVELWTRQFGTSSGDIGYGITMDSTGVYIIGTTGGTLSGQSSAGGTDIFIRKYDPNDGNVVWTKQFGTSANDDARDIYVDTSGIYIAGSTDGTFPDQTSSGQSDLFIRKYGHDGTTELFTLQYGTNSNDRAFGLYKGLGKDIYVGGGTSGTFPAQTNAGGIDAFLTVPIENEVPVANAGADLIKPEGAQVFLDGSASNDPDGTIASYAWTQTAGPSVTLTGADTANPTFTAPSVTTDTTLTFSLVVTDNDGASSTADTVNVLVTNVNQPDTTPPNTTIDSAVDGKGKTVSNGGSTTSNTIKFTFSGTDNTGVASFMCSKDGAAFSSCGTGSSGSITYTKISKGTHTFLVKAVDTSGNQDPTPATFTWSKPK